MDTTTIPQEYTFKDYLNYQVEIDEKVNTDDKNLISNKGPVHAILLANGIFKNAIKNNTKNFYMYCGSFHFFSDEFEKELDDELNRVKPNSEDVLFNSWKDFKPYDKFKSSLLKYLNDGGKLDVIVEEDIKSSLRSQDIWKDLSSFVMRGLISFSLLKFGARHFMVSGNAFRKETDEEAKTAIGYINNEESASILRDNFYFLKDMAVPLVF